MLYCVADGMGGHAGGATASRMAVDTIHRTVRTARQNGSVFPPEAGNLEVPEVLELLQRAVSEASRQIYEASSRNPELHGMGTTATLVQFLGSRIYVAHVGDSRLYRSRASGMTQLTRDHSLLEDYKDAKPDMTEEEERNFPHKNVITRALGMRESVEVDIHQVSVEDGDIFLLCSDGLSGMVTDPQIQDIVQRSATDLERCVAELVDQANRAGGTDNITCLVLGCHL